MAMIAPKPAPAPVAPAAAPAPVVAVPTVNIATLPTGVRVLTIELPPKKEYTEEMIEQLTRENEGQRPVAICDVTGDVIFKMKNANKIVSERPEFNDKVVSTRFLKKIFDVVEGTQTNP